MLRKVYTGSPSQSAVAELWVYYQILRSTFEAWERNQEKDAPVVTLLHKHSDRVAEMVTDLTEFVQRHFSGFEFPDASPAIDSLAGR